MFTESLCVFNSGTSACSVCGYASPDIAVPRSCPGARQASLPTHGPGTELSKLLNLFGINPTPTCSCRAKAQEMNAWGCDECSKPERIDEVVAVMREEAEARGLPFLDFVARLLVWWAVWRARSQAA